MTSSGDIGSESMGELAAHLDRAWDMLQKGDFAGAEKAAEAAIAVDPEVPEAHHVLGNVRAQKHDIDGAIESYERALELEESFLEAMLSLAEVHLHPLKDFTRAEELADEAYAWCETPEEEIDVLLVKAEAQLGRGDKSAAERTLGRLPKLPKPENAQEAAMHASLRLAIGRLFFDLGDIRQAAPHIEAAAAHESAGAEAFYAAGLLADARKNRRQAGIFFLRADALVRRHDALTAPFFSSDAFEDKVRTTLGKLSDKHRAMIEGALWIVAEYPGIEMVADGIDPRIPIFAETEHEVQQREMEQQAERVDSLGAASQGALSQGALSQGALSQGAAANTAEIQGPGNDPSTTSTSVVLFDGQKLPRIARIFVYSRNIEKLAGEPSGIDDELLRCIGDEMDHLLENQKSRSSG